MTTLRTYGLFVFVGGVSIGALMRSVFVWGFSVPSFMLLLVIVFGLAFHFTHYVPYLFIALALCGSVVGMVRAMATPLRPPAFVASRIGENTVETGIIVFDPDIRETTQRLVVDVPTPDGVMRVLAVASLYPEVAYQERVRITGVLSAPEAFETDGGRSFRYDHYLAKDGIFVLMKRAQLEVVGPPEGVFAYTLGALYRIKHEFVEGLLRALPEPHAGLAAGILVGGKQGLGKELLESFTVAGLVQIVVLSGYNVMIIAQAFLRLSALLSKRLSILIAAASIIAFVLAAGSGSAALRAGLMACLGLFALLTGRTYDALRALALVLFMMLMVHPLLLAYDVGFQFSFVATLGLIIGTPLITPRLRFVRYAGMREIIATTLAAQIGVLPLLLYHTGNFSLVALPANILILPMVPLAMLFSFIAGMAGILVAPLAPVIALPAYASLSYIIWVGVYAAQLPFARILIPAFSWWVVALSYLLLISLVIYLHREGKRGTFKNRKEGA